MFLKTLRMAAAAYEADSVRPSSLKHWWKIANDEALDGTVMIDVIGGANYSRALNSYLSTGIFAPNNGSDEVLTAPLSLIGTKKFLFLANVDVNGFANLGLGDDSGNRVRFGDGIIAQTQVEGSGGIVAGLDNFADTAGAYKTYALWYDGTDAHSKIDNGTTNDTTGDPGEITLLSRISLGNVPGLTGAALFIFDGDVPADLEEAAWFMGSSWASLDKVIYPSEDSAWGAWS